MVKQYGLILFFSFLGELLHGLLPFPVPASIYGLLLLFGALCLGVVNLSSVREGGNQLLRFMPLMFVPPVVGLLDSWSVLRPLWLPFCLVTVASTFAVMGGSGLVTQWLLRMRRRGRHE